MSTISDIETLIASEVDIYISTYNRQLSLENDNYEKIKICRGWPQEEELNNDLMSSPGTSWILVNQGGGVSKNTTRYSRQWKISKIEATFGITVENIYDNENNQNIIKFSGIASLAGIAGIVINSLAFSVHVKQNDTAAILSQNIFDLFQDNNLVSFDQETFYIKNSKNSYGKCAALIEMYRETNRSKVLLCTTIMSPSIEQRDLIELHLMNAILFSEHLNSPSFDRGVISFHNRTIDDRNLNANLYRIDLYWQIEIASIERKKFPPILWPGMDINMNKKYGIF